MRRVLAVVLLAGLCLCVSDAATRQGSQAERRAAELAAIFSKSKHEVREKKGRRVEKFKEVKSEPAVLDAAAYAGEYVTGEGCGVTVRFAAGGALDVGGCEPGEGGNRWFTLKDARLEGALLTGTKVYADGAIEKFEGLFINRTDRDSPTDAGTTTFGLGVYLDPPRTTHNGHLTMSRIFYQKK